MSNIHPTAIIADGAVIGADVEIGPYSCIGPDVSLADRVVLKSHVVVEGKTTVGEGTQIFPFASIGQQPQDLKYGGEDSRLEIGCDNIIREYVTMNTGTEGGGMLTRIGDRCLIMGAAHIAHDCRIGDNVILAQGALLGGHVEIDDFAILGGGAAVHQFVRIGAHAMIGGMAAVDNDVIPYASVSGDRAALSGLNIIGMKRRKFNRDEIHSLRAAFKALFGSEGTLQERIDQVEAEYGEAGAVADIIGFMRQDSSRSFVRPSDDD
jgi:UDP-N-acetylglucosamine acyltransferase